MSSAQGTNPPADAPWIKLHLARQSEGCMMPPYMIGRLQKELPNQYVLSNVLEAVEDTERARGLIIREREYFDTINRTYVWRVEMLGHKPEELNQMYEVPEYGGGLG